MCPMDLLTIVMCEENRTLKRLGRITAVKFLQYFCQVSVPSYYPLHDMLKIQLPEIKGMLGSNYKLR